MSTLTPIGGRGRRRGAALPVIVVGVLALLIGGLAGWYLTRDTSSASSPPPSTTPGACPSPSGSAGAKATKHPKPGSITVDVYNATDRQGLAAKTADDLEQRGFKIGDVDNDPKDKTIAVSAEIRYGKKGKSNAVVVAAQFTNPKMVNDKRADKTVSVALGNGYTALATPESAASALAPTPTPSC